MARVALSGDDRQSALRLLPIEPAQAILQRLWDIFHSQARATATDTTSGDFQRQQLLQLQQAHAAFLRTLQQDNNAPSRILETLSAVGSQSHSPEGILSPETSPETRRRILYLGEGRLEHQSKYEQHLPNAEAVRVTTLLTPDDFTTAISSTNGKVTEHHLHLFEARIAAIRGAGIELEAGFNALQRVRGQGEERYDQIYFDFPRISLRNVGENIEFVSAVMAQMAQGGFMHQNSEIIITLGLENQHFNPLQLLHALSQGQRSGTDPAQPFVLQQLALVHNQRVSGDDLSLMSGNLLTVPVSVQMTFKLGNISREHLHPR